MESIDIVKKAAQILSEKKAVDIKAIKISELTIMADYFLIASGTSTTHVRSLADDVEDALTKEGIEPRGVEGRTTGWILLDYYGVVIHVFTPKEREYYNLERLWSDASFVELSDVVKE